MLLIKKPYQFVWDKGNKNKNLIKHKITNNECEEIFFDKEKKMLKDRIHSKNEDRFVILGKTKNNKLLFVVFTVNLYEKNN